MDSSVLILIPARMASVRLPGKPLADIGGEPMIVRVMRVAQAAAVGPVAVATDSSEIAAAVTAAGGRAVMTRSDHASGSDRIFEAVEQIDADRKAAIVVNLQGDFPTLQGADIKAALGPLADPAVDIATLALEITEDAERTDPNVVKAICSALGTRRSRSGSTRIAARRSPASSACPPRRSRSASGSSNSARSKPACASTSRSPKTRSSASTRRSIWTRRAPC